MQEKEVSEEEESQNRIEDEKEREEVLRKKWKVKGKKSRLGTQEDNLVSVISIIKNSESSNAPDTVFPQSPFHCSSFMLHRQQKGSVLRCVILPRTGRHLHPSWIYI